MRHPLLLVLICLLTVACGKVPPPVGAGSKPPPSVGVASPLIRELPEMREYTGRVEAMQEVDLRARIGGTIRHVAIRDGAAVKAGDLVLELDPAPQQALVTRAQAEVARCEAALFQARQQFDRAKRLVADQVVSRQQYDDAEASVHITDAALAAARAALEATRIDLDFTRITAPISGRIGRVLATTGNVVQASGAGLGTLLATLVAVDPLYVVFDVDEATWRQTGDRLRLSADGGPQVQVSFGIAGENGFPHKGSISFVDNQIDPASGSIRVRATVANPRLELTPGAFARVQMEVVAAHRMILIDERAVQSQLTTRYVLTVDDQGKTAIRPVQLGMAQGTLRVVEKGLDGTERLAVNNLAKIFIPGMMVHAVAASMETLMNLPSPDDRPAGKGPGGAAPGQAGAPGEAQGTRP